MTNSIELAGFDLDTFVEKTNLQSMIHLMAEETGGKAILNRNDITMPLDPGRELTHVLHPERPALLDAIAHVHEAEQPDGELVGRQQCQMQCTRQDVRIGRRQSLRRGQSADLPITHQMAGIDSNAHEMGLEARYLLTLGYVLRLARADDAWVQRHHRGRSGKVE